MRRFVICFFILSIFFSSGCYTLRRKFIRKKKYEKEPSVFVDFKEYHPRPSREAYIDYYLFVRGWLDELIEALAKGESFKREKRAIDEAIMNFEQIFSFYNLEGKEKIYPLYEELLAIKKEMEQSPSMSQIRRNSLIFRVEHFKGEFERNYNFVDAQKWMD